MLLALIAPRAAACPAPPSYPHHPSYNLRPLHPAHPGTHPSPHPHAHPPPPAPHIPHSAFCPFHNSHRQRFSPHRSPLSPAPFTPRIAHRSPSRSSPAAAPRCLTRAARLAHRGTPCAPPLALTPSTRCPPPPLLRSCALANGAPCPFNLYTIAFARSPCPWFNCHNSTHTELECETVEKLARARERRQTAGEGLGWMGGGLAALHVKLDRTWGGGRRRLPARMACIRKAAACAQLPTRTIGLRAPLPKPAPPPPHRTLLASIPHTHASQTRLAPLWHRHRPRPPPRAPCQPGPPAPRACIRASTPSRHPSHT